MGLGLGVFRGFRFRWVYEGIDGWKVVFFLDFDGLLDRWEDDFGGLGVSIGSVFGLGVLVYRMMGGY